MVSIFENNFLKISVVENDGDNCIFSFTGVGHGLGGIDLQTEEFKRLNPNYGSQLIIVDKERSWGNSIDFEKLIEIVKPYFENKKVICLGNSMGGFLAILTTKFIEVERCISFSPQFSVSPRVMPSEKRWLKYTKNISLFNFESLSDCFSEQTLYFLIFGDDSAECQHSARFPNAENIFKIVAGNDHNVARSLRDRGLLYPLIDLCISSEKPSADLQRYAIK